MSTNVCFRICSNILEDHKPYPRFPDYHVDEKLIPDIKNNPLTKPISDNLRLFEELVTEKIAERIRYFIDEGFGYVDDDNNFVPEPIDVNE